MSVATAVFKSDIKPDVEVSQYISSLETSGSVSKIAKFSSVSYGLLVSARTPNGAVVIT